MVRLGAGGLDGRALTPEAMHAALQVLSKFRRLADSHLVDEIIAVATSATREAAAAETEWRGRARAARTASDSARDALAQFERARTQTLSRLSAVEEAFSRAGAARLDS